MKCCITVSSEEAREQGITHGGTGWTARDVGAPWCEQEATNFVTLAFGERTAHVEVCAEHAAEYYRLMEAV